MPKLSSARLKAMIPLWLSSGETRKLLSCHSDFSGGGSPEEQASLLARACEWFDLPKGSSVVQLEERVWSLWCDPKQWKRTEKRRLKDDWPAYFYEDCGAVLGDDYVFCHGEDECLRHACTEPRSAYFKVDHMGGYDQDRVNSCWANSTRAQACWLRVFVPDNELADNYRLEVVTTPEDDAVVGWSVYVD